MHFRVVCVLAVLLLAFAMRASAATAEPSEFERQPPRIRALLEQAWALEHGTGGQLRNQAHAAALYCEAARYGSSEGHFRSGLLYLQGDASVRDMSKARSFLSFAQELGHPASERFLGKIDGLAQVSIAIPDCLNPEYVYVPPRFDLAAYVGALQRERQAVAALIVKWAPAYGVDQRLALAIAAVESNFNPRAVSPKQAQGVMQLMPDTAQRFNVVNPMDPEQNVRGGLAYLKWLLRRFAGNQVLTVAAYNAGEGAVQRYNGPPPFLETRGYLARVLKLSQ